MCVFGVSMCLQNVIRSLRFSSVLATFVLTDICCRPLLGTPPPDACSNAPRLLLLLSTPGVLLLSQHTLKWFPSFPMGLLEQGAKSERHEVSGASTIFMTTHSFYMANLHL